MWCEHWRRGRVDLPDGLPPIVHGVVLVETYTPVDLQPEEAELPLAYSGVPITYISVSDFINLAVELRTVPELLAYLDSRRTIPLSSLRLIGDEMPLFEFYLLEGNSLNGCIGHADARLVVASRESELREMLSRRAEETLHIKAIEHVADALSTRHADFAQGLSPSQLAAFDDTGDRRGYLVLQSVLANLTRAKRAHVGKALETASSTIRKGNQGLAYCAVHFTPEDWAFVLCASRGVQRAELLRKVERLMRGAMAYYGKGHCMIVVDRDGENYEVALSRPDVRLSVTDYAAGDELFAHLRQTDVLPQVP